MTGAESVEGGV